MDDSVWPAWLPLMLGAIPSSQGHFIEERESKLEGASQQLRRSSGSRAETWFSAGGGGSKLGVAGPLVWQDPWFGLAGLAR